MPGVLSMSVNPEYWRTGLSAVKCVTVTEGVSYLYLFIITLLIKRLFENIVVLHVLEAGCERAFGCKLKKHNGW